MKAPCPPPPSERTSRVTRPFASTSQIFLRASSTVWPVWCATAAAIRSAMHATLASAPEKTNVWSPSRPPVLGSAASTAASTAAARPCMSSLKHGNSVRYMLSIWSVGCGS
eukprot:358278-Chlamydomonas_euryale.AAC.3